MFMVMCISSSYSVRGGVGYADARRSSFPPQTQNFSTNVSFTLQQLRAVRRTLIF